MTRNLRRGLVLAALVSAASIAPSRAEAGRPSPTPQPAQAAPAQRARPAAPALATVPDTPPLRAGERDPDAPMIDAEQTRDAFHRVLDSYSPNVGRVLALDPMLLQNPGYLDPYPEIRAFVQRHPEVLRSPSYYLGGFDNWLDVPRTREGEVLRMWQSFTAGIGVFVMFGVFIGTLAWLIKTLVNYRRWSRLSKVQTEAHNKLLDRFTANEELLAYIETPSGRRFLESAPIMLDSATSSVAAPVKRILWAVEIGVVLASLAAGVLFARPLVPAEIAAPLSVVGVVLLALGIGFVVAALASWAISRRLGVLPKANAAEVDAQPTA